MLVGNVGQPLTLVASPSDFAMQAEVLLSPGASACVAEACARAGVPLISAAITQWEGQISLYDPAHGGPCYECVFPERPLPGMVPTCAEAGVGA